MQNVDLIIESRWIATAESTQALLENYAIAVNQGVIVNILPKHEMRSTYSASKIVCLDDHIVIPGLINTHTHAAMSLMRGIADDKPLMTWLNDYIWPIEHAILSERYVYDATLLGCAEMLSGGITCFNDMYFYPQSTAEATTKIGMRAHLGLVVIEFPTAYASDAEDYLQKGFEAHDSWRNNALITSCLAPHAPYTVTNHTFEQIITYADQMGLGIHTHLHETRDEISNSETQFGVRPLKRLLDIGLLGPNLLAAHCVHLQPDEVELLASHGCHVAHCPSSNLKLASGIAPVAQLLNGQVNVCLGTDGAASNNRLDMFTEMRLSALLAKGRSETATVLPAQQALEMATINAAKALGMDDKIGSIVIGKQADLAAVKLSDFSMNPCYDPISHLVYTCGREQVTHTWVAGELSYCEGVYTNLTPIELNEIIQTWQPKIRNLI